MNTQRKENETQTKPQREQRKEKRESESKRERRASWRRGPGALARAEPPSTPRLEPQHRTPAQKKENASRTSATKQGNKFVMNGENSDEQRELWQAHTKKQAQNAHHRNKQTSRRPSPSSEKFSTSLPRKPAGSARPRARSASSSLRNSDKDCCRTGSCVCARVHVHVRALSEKT